MVDDEVVHSSPSLEAELGLNDDFDFGADVGLLGLGELVEVVATCALLVEHLVETLADRSTKPVDHVGARNEPRGIRIETEIPLVKFAAGIFSLHVGIRDQGVLNRAEVLR